jgi:hypothetical protein
MTLKKKAYNTLRDLGVKNSLISGKPLNKESFMVFAINPEDFEQKDHPLIKHITECWKEGKKDDK